MEGVRPLPPRMTRPDPTRVTSLLQRLSGGDRPAQEELLELVYDELRVLARAIFRGPGAATLQPTVLVHEAWLKLAAGPGGEANARAWESRRHFFAVAANAMRQVLANHARDARRDKRGGAWRRVTLHDVSAGQDELDLVALDDALEKLGEANEQHLEVFNLRYLAGLDSAETAEVLGVSVRTVQVRWRAVCAFLHHQLGDGS